MEKNEFFLKFVFFTALICYTQSQTVPAGCPAPEDLENAFTTGNEDSYAVGATVTYECRLGYDFTVYGDRRACLANSSWSVPQLSCVKQDCRLPPDVSNGEYMLNTGNTLFGTKATYTCDTGFSLSAGDRDLTCSVRSDENIVYWRGTPPTCANVLCGVIIAPENGSFDDGGVSEYRYRTPVTFNCNPGFKLSNESLKTVTCGATGSWGEFPTCEVNYGCDFEDATNFPCGYTNDGWDREFISRDYRNKRGYLSRAATSSGASLTSQSLTIGDQGACLSFYYRIQDGNAATFSVSQQLSDGSGSPTTLFTVNQVIEWVPVQLDLVADGPITWKFEVSTQSANIELDDVVLEHVACPKAVPTTAPSAVATTKPSPSPDANTNSMAMSTTSTVVSTSTVAESSHNSTTTEETRTKLQTADVVTREATQPVTFTATTGDSIQLLHSTLMLVIMGVVSHLLIGMD